MAAQSDKIAKNCYALFKECISKQESVEYRSGMYSPALVSWLMIFQRLREGASLEDAVEEFSSGNLRELAGECKRTRDGKISNNTGGYSQARRSLPLETVISIADNVFRYLSEDRAVRQSKYGRPVYALDGAVLELLRSRELAKRYPPEKRGYYPSLRMVVCHDLESGLALRPEYGPYAGSKRLSEIGLIKKMFSRLPEDGIFIADRLYGIFSVVYSAKEIKRDFIVRLKDDVLRKVLGEAPTDGIDRKVIWKVSPHDRVTNPDFPKDAIVHGRIICRNVRPNNGDKAIPLYLFTTLENEPADIVIEMYGLRWNIEIDIRTLKQTVGMHALKVKSVDMAGKEVILGICAYNLVVAVRILAAQQLNLPPRALSFKRTLVIIECYTPKILFASGAERTVLVERFWRAMKACKHPKRTRVRVEPRALVRCRRSKFPTIRGSRAAARKKLVKKN